MKPKTNLFLTVMVITLVTLACATLTNGPTPEPPAPPAELPTNTPLPPAPTSTPLPPAPEPTAEPAPPQPETGDVLFFDDFSNPNSGWDRYSDDEGFTDYENGAYKIGVYTDTFFYWANPYQDFGDQVIEVQATLTTSDTDNQYGIVCRHQDVNNWYALVISGDGFAAIRKRYQGSELEYIVDWVEVPEVNQGQATNNLRADCVGPRLSLYVNGVLAVETIDGDIQAGDAGLIAGTFDSTLVEVLFDNFKVSSPILGGSPHPPEPRALPGAGPDWELLTTVFYDEFNDDSMGWDNFETDTSAVFQFRDEYMINVKVEQQLTWALPHLSPMSDVVVSVDADQKAGVPDETEYGIICRYQDNQNWYAFFVSGEGYALAKKVVNGELNTIHDWVPLEGFHTGETDVNNLMVSCSGDTMTLYVNSIFALSVSDTDVATGDVGIIVGTYDESNAEVTFDNFRVGTP